MILRLVAVGRMKDKALGEACAMYAKRVRHYFKLELVEVREAGLKEKRTSAARGDEGKALLRRIPDSSKVVALTREGESETSSQFASRLRLWRDEASDVTFVIGGAHGLDESVLRRADWRLSISSMTLPHELARVTLLEQIYRACTILRGEPYHKGG